jgi:hypothetical protein
MASDLQHERAGLGRSHHAPPRRPPTLTEAIAEFRNGLDELEVRLEREARERQQVREAREERERLEERKAAAEREERRSTARRDRWARWLGATALVFTAIGTLYTLLGGPH